jgi:hypothetical protein
LSSPANGTERFRDAIRVATTLIVRSAVVAHKDRLIIRCIVPCGVYIRLGNIIADKRFIKFKLKGIGE